MCQLTRIRHFFPDGDMRKSPGIVSLLPLYGILRKINGPEASQMADATTIRTLNLDVEIVGTTAVVKCSGKLVLGVTDVLYTRVKKLIPDHTRIVLDLSDLIQMDSMGLGTLARLYVSCKAAHCELQLVNLGARVRQLLGTTNMLSVFAVIGENGVKF
jgi:anti-sigma B factor antagonist